MPACIRRLLPIVLFAALLPCAVMRPPDAVAQPRDPGTPGQDCGPVDRGTIAPGETVSGRINACIERRLMATGRYRIVATSFESAAGDYLLRLKIIGANATDRGTILPDET